MPSDYSEVLNIQSNYLDLLEGLFGGYYQEMIRLGSTPDATASFFAADPIETQKVLRLFENVQDELRSFWASNFATMTTSLSSGQTLTSAYGGNFFPPADHSIVRSAGIYIDTILLPDPLLRINRISGSVRPELLSAQVISNGIKTLIYRDVIFLDRKMPLALILPEPNSLSPEVQQTVSSLTEEAVKSVASRVFERDFSTLQEVNEYFLSIHSAESFISAVRQPNLLALRDDVSLGLEQQISELARGYSLGLEGSTSFRSVGHMIYSVFFGRIAQITELLVKAEVTGSSPLVESDGAWRQLMVHYGRVEHGGRLKDAAIAKALQSREHSGLDLLAATSLDDLKGYRNAEDVEVLRSKITAGINEVGGATADLLTTTTNRVAENLTVAFEEHSAKIKLLKQDRRQYYGRDVWKCVIPAGIAIVGTYSGYIPAEMIGALCGFLGLPAAPQLNFREKEIMLRGKQLNRSAAGMLFKHVSTQSSA